MVEYWKGGCYVLDRIIAEDWTVLVGWQNIGQEDGVILEKRILDRIMAEY
jgi:hypothetical protein